MAAAGQQLALEEGEEGIGEADQRAGRDGTGDGELPGVLVAVPPQGDQQRGQDDEHRLLGEDGRGGGYPRPEVVPEVAARGGGEGEREQRPHHREVVEEDLALEDDRERREPEQDHAESGGPAGQGEPAAQDVDQHRADAADHQHHHAHRADGHRLGADHRGYPGQQGELDPAERRVVVPVGVVGEALALLDGPGLGEVGALVVAEGRVVGDVPALDDEDRHQEDTAQQEVGAGGPQPLRRDCSTGRTGLGCRLPLRGDRGGGHRGKGGGHAGTSSRNSRFTSAGVRCAPTCVVSSQSVRPRCSRHTARMAAPARSTW
jgi:hypothetical protein